VPDAVVEDIRGRSEGNAYYAEELLAAVDGSSPRARAGWRSPSSSPTSCSPASRACRPPSSRWPGSPRWPAGACPTRCCAPPPACRRPTSTHALREAVAHHVLVPDGSDRYAFRHALLQEAVYGDLLPGERVRLHATYARLLAERDGASAADLARHADGRARPARRAGRLDPRRGRGRRRPGTRGGAGALRGGPAAVGRRSRRRRGPRTPTCPGSPCARRRPPGRPASTTAPSPSPSSRAADRGRPARRGRGARPARAPPLRRRPLGRRRARGRHGAASCSREGPSPVRVWTAAIQARMAVSDSSSSAWRLRRAGRRRGARPGLASAEGDLLVSLALQEGRAGDVETSAARAGAGARAGRRAPDPALALRSVFTPGHQPHRQR
jgi:hypothetical protein